MKKNRLVFLELLLILAVACADSNSLVHSPGILTSSIINQNIAGSLSKWDLWAGGKTQLRGANIWQSLVIPLIDGDFKGNGRVGPPYSQADFDQLAALGANYLVLSVPGIYTEKPPYQLDSDALQNLDDLLSKAKNADLFVTIAFRTGPGRAEWSLCCAGSPEYADYYNDIVWTDAAAQLAWAEMWRTTAERYRSHPEVVGYELMVEPDGESLLLDIWNPEDFYPKYANSLYDWNQFYPKLVDAIRSVDEDTPIVVPAASYSRIQWLPAVKVIANKKVVYDFHQYDPHEAYTHQPPGGKHSYPGNFDLNGDGNSERFDQTWLQNLFEPAITFSQVNKVSLAVNEFGVMRWVPKAADFIRDQVDIFEANGWNHAVWVWPTSYGIFSQVVNEFNIRLGPLPANKTKNVSSSLQDVLVYFWKRNAVRPSDGSWR